jgi:hypothetical protein
LNTAAPNKGAMELIENSTNNIFELCDIITKALIDRHGTYSDDEHIQSKLSYEEECVILTKHYNKIREFHPAPGKWMIGLMSNINSLLNASKDLRAINDVTHPLWHLLSLYHKILDDFCTKYSSIVALYGYYRITRLRETDDPICVLKIICGMITSGKIITFGEIDKLILQQLLLRIILLTDIDDNNIIRIIINRREKERCGATMLPFVHYIVNNVHIESTSILTELMSNIITIVYGNSSSQKSDIHANYRRYYILLVKLVISYQQYNNISSFWSYIDYGRIIYLHTIAHYVSGTNNQACKLYKYLLNVSNNDLTTPDKLFMTIMGPFLYAPGGQGALGAAEDFHERLAADL